MDQRDCLICQKHRGEAPVPGGIVYEGETCRITHSFIPKGEKETMLGVFFIEPKRHTPAFEDMTDAEAQEIGLLITRLSRALKKVVQAEHIYIFRLGHHVDHLHVWVVPRYSGTPPQFWGLKVDEWEGTPRGGEEAIATLCAQVSRELEG